MTDEGYHKGMRDGFVLGLIEGIRKVNFHKDGRCYVYVFDEKEKKPKRRYYADVLNELLEEHEYNIKHNNFKLGIKSNDKNV